MLNREWHIKHKMPENATLEQRIKWHIAHEKNCSCRPMTEKMRVEIAGRKTTAAK